MPRKTFLGFLLIPLLTTSAQTLDSPDSFLGYHLGDRFTRYHDIVGYFEYVAETSPRVQLVQYGETVEGRLLLTAIVSTLENLDRIDDIRLNNLRAAGMEEGNTSDGLAIVWLSYGVHGNESSSSEAAMQTLYELAGTSRDEVTSWLRDAVVVIDPCLNPDGRDRYVNWFNSQVGRKPDRDRIAREHREPWPGGRTNHYYFDLNRDWAWLSQQESRFRVAHYSSWMPHIHVDFHEQGINAPYYFAPAAQPYHELITEGQKRIERIIGDNNMQYFDANDWLYFTREVFDLLYPGYGDTWPVFNGAIGMTYEQAGGSRAGIEVLNDEKLLLTLGERIDHHVTAGLSTIEAAARNKELILSEFAEYYRTALDGVGAYRNYVISGHPDNIDALRKQLADQGIEFSSLTSDGSVNGFSYRSGDDARVPVKSGDLVVSAAQPKSRLVSVLLEPRTAVADSLTYDITAWSLPYVYNVDAVATNDNIASHVFGTEDSRPAIDPDPYAFVLTWNSDADVRVLAALARRDVRARVATVPFTIDGASFERGSIIVTSADNKHHGERLGAIVDSAASANSQLVASIASGFAEEGKDIGSAAMSFLNMPRVALIMGESISTYGAGEVWDYFDNVIDYPLTRIDPDDFDDADLSKIDVLIMPDGSYSSMLPEGERTRLTDWLRGGGKLIALESAVSFLSGKDPFAIKTRDAAKPDTSLEARLIPFDQRERERIGSRVTGAIFNARVDNTHPLAFGYGNTYYTLKESSRSFEYMMDDYNVAVIESGLPLSGFAGHRVEERLKNTVLWGHQSIGSGDVIYFVDNPIFRGFWFGGRLALANAIFIVGQ